MSGPDPWLLAAFAVAIALDVAVPLALVLFLRRRFAISWKVVGWGALVFALSQLLTRIPLVQLTQYLLRDALKASAELRIAWLLLLSVTAGLFEETGRYLAFRFRLKTFRSWKDGLAFGAGHGGLESALLVGGMAALGLVNVVVLSSMSVDSLSLPPEQLEQVRAAKAQIAALRAYEPLLGAWERVCSLSLHLVLSVWVLRAVASGSARRYWLAVGYHAAGNALAALAMQHWGIFAAEGALTVLLALNLWLLSREKRWDGWVVTP